MSNENNVAIGGYDTVAYFTEGRPVPGSEEFLHKWGGSEWRFMTAGNRDAFAAEPDRYAPQYGGHCGFAMSLGKSNAPQGSPKSWKIVDGKLYFALNPVAKFLMGVLPNRIEKADGYWPTFSAKGV